MKSLIVLLLVLSLTVAGAYAFTYAKTYDENLVANAYVIMPYYDYIGPLYNMPHIQDDFVMIDFEDHHKYVPVEFFY